MIGAPFKEQIRASSLIESQPSLIQLTEAKQITIIDQILKLVFIELDRSGGLVV
jgi:hypothetical protein